MNRRDFFKRTCALGTAAFLSRPLNLSNAGAASTEKPNILFFLVDDMGWQDTSEPFYKEKTELNQRYYTPNMEQVADEGMKFTQAYACSLCSPTRVSLMTGLNAARHRVTNWTLRKDKSPDPKHKTLDMPEWNVNGLSPVPEIDHTVYVKTLPMFLQEAGYHTIHCGKAHWGADGTPGEDPLNLGFDVNIGGHCAGGPGSYYGKYDFSADWRNEDRIWDVPGLEAYHGQDIYLTEALTLEANKAIDKAVEDKKPFYLYMSHYAIHAPWEKDDRYFQKYKEQGLDDWDAAYASMLEGMDKSLGDLRANRKRHGIEDNTIIIFMTDNGQPSQADLNLPLRGHKLTPYEGGIRVPTMVKWPGVTEANTVCDECFIIEDLFPTIMEMAGVTGDDQIGGVIDGVSVVPLLQQTEGYPKDRAIFWHFPHSYNQYPYSIIRKGKWKLIYFHEDEHYELYDIDEDISESRNLHAEQPEIARGLARELGAFMKNAKALMPISKQSGKPVPLPG